MKGRDNWDALQIKQLLSEKVRYPESQCPFYILTCSKHSSSLLVILAGCFEQLLHAKKFTVVIWWNPQTYL